MPARQRLALWPACCLFLLVVQPVGGQETKILSHPPLRTAPPPAERPLADGRGFFVDPARGDDAREGSQEAPWRTLAHAVTRLEPGDTLYLRGGVYWENVAIRLAGRPDAPITIRAFPGEQPILDGGLREFYESPQDAWVESKSRSPNGTSRGASSPPTDKPKPAASAKEGPSGPTGPTYRSARPYRNLRNVMGWFGDSMVGLSTYFHAQDLQADNELVRWPDPNRRDTTDIDPLYCGPGLWYDQQTGYIHVRLAPTHLPIDANFRGETDPRKLPLVIAPFRSLPLTLDGAEHVRIQDLVIRGGGYNTVVLDHSHHVEFDNVTIWCGTYGMRTVRTTHLRVHHCGLYGSCPPWLFRNDSSKRAYPGRPHRDITRLNTHASWVTEAGREFSTFATPVNEHFEVSHCEFTDAHDGPYFGGVTIDFHHNLIENMQDDGMYLSQMYPRHIYGQSGAVLKIHHNVFRGVLTALAFGGPEDTRDQIFIYRNVFELCSPVPTGRPAEAGAAPGVSYGKVMGDHGSPPWPAMTIYHNTFVVRESARYADMELLGHARPEHPRRVFNNLFVHLTRLPGYLGVVAEAPVAADGNFYWSPAADAKTRETFFDRFRNSPAFAASKQYHPPGADANSQVADPQLMRAEIEGENDYRLHENSPAIDAGAALPQDWPDDGRSHDQGPPDAGALPIGAQPLQVGRSAA